MDHLERQERERLERQKPFMVFPEWRDFEPDIALGDPDSFIDFEGQQKAVWDFQARPGRGLLLSVGTVRSGKSYPSGLGWLNYSQLFAPVGSLHLCIGPSKETLRQTHFWMFGWFKKKMNLRDRAPRWTDGVFEFNKRHYRFVGGTDKDSGEVIRGLTGHSLLAEEITSLPPEFFAMALTRLSYRHSKAFCTTNPAGTRHWVLVNYIQQDGFDVKLDMSFEDNPALSEEAKDGIRKNLKLAGGAQYQRLGLGRWADSDDIVYPVRWVIEETDPHFRAYSGASGDDLLGSTEVHYGLDFGVRDLAVLSRTAKLSQLGISFECEDQGTAERAVIRSKYIALKSLRLDDQKTVQGTLRAIIQQIVKDGMHRRPKRKGLVIIYTDWSHCELFERERKAFLRSEILLGKMSDLKDEISLDNEQAVAKLIRFRLAEKDRPFGISNVRSALSEGKLVIAPDATGIIEEAAGYEFPEGEGDTYKTSDDLEDDHMDAMRYGYLGAARLVAPTSRITRPTLDANAGDLTASFRT